MTLSTTKNKTPRQGFTLLELVISMALLILIMLVMGGFAMRAAAAFESMATSFHHNSRAVVVVDRVVEELLSGDFTSIDPPVPLDSDFLEFDQIVDVVDDTPVFGARLRLDTVPMEVASADGRDENRNGLIDEVGLRIWEDRAPFGGGVGAEDSEAVVCGNLVPGGLRFTRDGGLLLVELTFQKVIERGLDPARFTVRTAVSLRNGD